MLRNIIPEAVPVSVVDIENIALSTLSPVISTHTLILPTPSQTLISNSENAHATANKEKETEI